MNAQPLYTIKNEIPFASPIYYWIHIGDIPLDTLVAPSRHFERPYLAWETVRKLRNPFFDNGTGFEGYFVGFCKSPDEALHRVLTLSQDMLDSIHRLHRMDYATQSRLMKTLAGESSSLSEMREWSDLLGATLAKLRTNVRQNRRAEIFQTETYYIVSRLPTIDYRVEDSTIEQSYRIGLCSVSGGRKHVSFHTLNASQQEAWRVAQLVGRFGHPLVRQYLRRGQS